MARWFLIFLYSALLVGAVSAAQTDGDPSRHSYVTCDDKQISTFGNIYRAEPMAELSAIVRWRHETRERRPGYDNWGLAQKRQIKCQRFDKGSYVHCSASAQPCKPKRT